MNNIFPPSKVSDLDTRSVSNFLSLLRDSGKLPIVLVLGSGASASAGLPIWRELLRRVCTMFFAHWESDIEYRQGSAERPPRNLSIAFTDYFDLFWSEKSGELANGFVNEDPLLTAQQVRNCIREADWRYLLRKSLYTTNEGDYIDTNQSKLLDVLARYCAEAKTLAAVIDYNYDNTFEEYLKRHGVKFEVLAEPGRKRHEGRLPIFYPHGYLRRDGGPTTRIIIAESDYQQESAEPYSWPNLVQMQFFVGGVCIFVGASMTDPNLRRLLRLSTSSSSASHYAFLPSEAEPVEQQRMYNSLFDHDLAELGVKVIRVPKRPEGEDRHSRLSDLVEIMRANLNDPQAIWRT